MIPYGSLIVYVTPRGRRYILRLAEDQDWHSNEGILRAADVAQAEYGAIVTTSLGVPVRVEEATLEDRLMGMKRQTQIIYPKDVAQICLKIGAGPGRLIVEAGCGSGSLTMALSWFCGPTGKIVSHDAREEFVRLARRNLEWAGLGQNVELHCRDIADGFMARNADAVFLDVREPWLYLGQALKAARPGASFAFLLPTVNQVEALLAGLEKADFTSVEVCELLLRKWKLAPDRLRPNDRMVAHTGFLVFCRQGVRSEAFENFLPRGTRERKEEEARQRRQAGMETPDAGTGAESG